VLYESYDYDCNAVLQEYYSSDDGHTRLLFDFEHKKLWRLFAPNTTYEQGLCAPEPIAAEVPFEKITGRHVATSSMFLGARSQEWTYHPRSATNNAEVR
jgi:hypothetical protein